VEVLQTAYEKSLHSSQTVQMTRIMGMYEGWNFNSGNYLFTTDTK